ncbi:hypothetical protein ACFQY7_50170 [Actinomadura luteofluorescens]
MGDHLAFVHIFAQEARPAFEPARISPDECALLSGMMRQRPERANELTWPEGPAEPADREPEPPARPGAVSKFDVLRLNGGGPSGMFSEAWAQPADTPRDPAIGYGPGGHPLSLYPLDRSSGIPHGLVVGSPEARQKVVRAVTLALTAGHSPADLQFLFAGLGQHPLGDPIDLPHVLYSEEELLGSPERLRRFFEFLSDELEARSAGPPQDVSRPWNIDADEFNLGEMYERFRQDPHSVSRAWWDFFEDYQPGEQLSALPTPPETRPRLLVVVDLSLTFPSSRREVGETLLSLAQRGRALDVQLLLTSSTVENTTIWDRFLPLLGWRIAADHLPPDQLQRVLGQANLQFPDGEPTAYFLAGGGSPQRFTVAPEPPRATIADFVRRTRAPQQGSSADSIGVEDIGRMFAELDAAIENERRMMGGEPFDGATVQAALQEILWGDADTLRSGRGLTLRNLVFPAPFRPEMIVTARLYGKMLNELGLLSPGTLSIRPFHELYRLRGDPRDRPGLLSAFRGHILLVRDEAVPTPTGESARLWLSDTLNSGLAQGAEGPLVILCGEPEELSARLVGFVLESRYVRAFESVPPPPRTRPSRGRTMRLGSDPETGESVILDFDVDRHLLISGPSRPEKAALVDGIVDKLAASGNGQERLIYVLDTGTSQRDRKKARAWQRRGVRHTGSPGDFRTLLTEASGSLRTHPPSDGGPEIHLVVASHPDTRRNHDSLAQVVPHLGALLDEDVHLVLALNDLGAPGPFRPVIARLRQLDSPVLLTHYVGGAEASLWDLPVSSVGPLFGDHALLARPGRQRRVRLDGVGR